MREQNERIASVESTLDTALVDPALATGRMRSLAASPAAERAACFHCGEPCRDEVFSKEEKVFCCQGCLVVHELLAASGLEQFYDLSPHPGRRTRAAATRSQWSYLDDPRLQQGLLDFTDGKLSRVTFHIPAIHCIACVWLLENLFRLHAGVGQSRVNFPKREVGISFAPAKIALSELVALLAAIGYEPELTLGTLEPQKISPSRKRQWLQVGVAGFAFGNIMLLSLPLYLGLDSFSGPVFRMVFGCLSLGLAAPVLVYSASDYWRSALVALRQRVLTLDVPIALGLAALYAQSTYEIVSGRGGGYLDSLAGLVFLLLCGRVFQQKTYDRMAFDRDYKCFFPLAVMRKAETGEESVAISQLQVGDRLTLRHGELIPADARLVSPAALIDYSFVSGESEPVAKAREDYLYAGGRLAGGAIEIETVKAVSQSYLTSLWNHEAFQKDRQDNLNTLTNRYSQRFTRIVIGIALIAGLGWWLAGDAPRGLKAFTSVLIVACPCALALAAPFTLGTAQRLLAGIQIFLRNTLVVERMAQVNTIVFDKTGTLTAAQAEGVTFCGMGSGPRAEVCRAGFESQPALSGDIAGGLSPEELSWVYSVARHSTHPLSRRIAGNRAEEHTVKTAEGFAEIPGCGIQGIVDGHEVRLGSRAWLEGSGIEWGGISPAALAGSVVGLAIDGRFRGAFILGSALRPETGRLLEQLGKEYQLALLSGDNEREREQFRALFGTQARLHFNQSPLDKLGFIRELQDSGRSVMMVGDGLNDAGALKQSDVGVAVVEQVGAFSPASDIILAAAQVPQLCQVLSLARRATRIVRWSFGISAAYNLVGISIAAAGIFSPLICAILMPLSSITVVLFACGTTRWTARTLGLKS